MCGLDPEIETNVQFGDVPVRASRLALRVFLVTIPGWFGTECKRTPTGHTRLLCEWRGVGCICSSCASYSQIVVQNFPILETFNYSSKTREKLISCLFETRL